ncbi:MAG: hypothetical protein WCV88_04300 [Patescibacteria group bacterium]|jgi:hypothetical protein
MFSAYSFLLVVTWKHYLNRFEIVLFSHLVFSLPVLCLITWLQGWFPIGDTINDLNQLWPNFYIQTGLSYVATTLTSITGIMLIVAMRQAINDQPTTFLVVLKKSLPYYLPVVGITVLETIITASGFVLLVIPGIILSILLTFWVTLYVWFDLTIIDAFKHGIRLIWNNFWRITLYLLLVQILLSSIVFLLTWSLPTNFIFDVFISFISALCASFYILFVTVLMTTCAPTKTPAVVEPPLV